MPPTTPLPPPTGDVVPWPGSALILGGGKFLLETGDLVTKRPRGHRPCNLTANTLKYWEATADRGQGANLSELMG